MEQRRCEDIDAFRHPRLPVAEDLRAQKSAGSAIASHPDVQFLCVPVVDLVVPGLCSDGDGIKSRSARFGFAQAPPRDRQIEDLDRCHPGRAGGRALRLFIGMG